MWTKTFLFQKRILWYGLLLPFVMILIKSSFFLPFFKNVLHSLLSYWLLKSFAFYSLLSLLFYDACKRACLCDTCRISHLHRDMRSPVEVLPEGLSFIQLRKSHRTRASMHPARSLNTACLSSSACSCVCFVCERKPGVHSFFLQMIKAQNQSPYPLIYFVWLFRKASMCYSVCVFAQVCACIIVCVCVCVSIVRCQQALQACTVYPFQNPFNAAIPFKTVSGVTELSFEVGLLSV